MKKWPTSIAIVSLIFLSSNSMATEYPGTLVWGTITTLSTPLNGRITSVKVTTGDEITKGQLLATLDPRLYQARVKRAQARLQSLQNQFQDISREYDRAKELYERTVLSQTDLQSAEVEYFTREAELQQAEAELQLAKVNLEYTQLRAPFDGIVVERNVNPHETVSNQLHVTPMLRIAQKQPLAARFIIPFTETAQLKRGASLNVTIETRDVNATLTSLSINDEGERLITVSITPPQSSFVGQRAILNLP